ncbi:TSCPD domain-containing protein, partial [Acidisphaera rubrifaciens]
RDAAVGTVRVGVLAPGVADALLGIETAGIAPPFSPITDGPALTRTARATLAARGLSAEAALARLYAGEDPLPVAAAAAHAAMREAVAPFLHVLPEVPGALPAPPAATGPVRQDLPPRRRGYTQKATVGGHRIYLRTGEYADGRLGEIEVSLPKDSPAVRGLMDSLAQAISLGLQHGVPLSAYVEALAGTRFGAQGSVEGDPAVTRASSPVDYVARSLAASYLGRHDLPEAAPESPAPAAPELPLDLPAAGTPGRRLRLVASRTGT